MGYPPLNHLYEMEDLKFHLISLNINTIWDISVWNQDDSWKDWNIPCPLQLMDAKRQFLQILKGKSPTSSSVKDSRGWGNK